MFVNYFFENYMGLEFGIESYILCSSRFKTNIIRRSDNIGSNL